MNCRSCAAPILWAVTTTGNMMPVDVDPSPDGNVILDHDHDPPHATVVGGDPDLFGDVRFKSHFATCPDGPAWRSR